MTISAKVIADSISKVSGTRITTFELEYPRFIHSEFMTHRVFSRNAASSRAIPVDSAIKLIEENIAMPIHWGKNQPGMTAKEECNARWIEHDSEGNVLVDWAREVIWKNAARSAIGFAKIFAKLGYHKQIVNRLLEPYSHIKVVLTTTELKNFFWLRDHSDAQPEIAELAKQMVIAAGASVPKILDVGSWHVPYYGEGYWIPSGYVNISKGDMVDLDDKYGGHTLQEALMISSSQCAQVSYRKSDDTLEKAKTIFGRLVESKPVHASPFEHQATPIPYVSTNGIDLVHDWQEGITHMDRYGTAWSGNFADWIQHRQLIPDNAQNEVRIK